MNSTVEIIHPNLTKIAHNWLREQHPFLRFITAKSWQRHDKWGQPYWYNSFLMSSGIWWNLVVYDNGEVKRIN